jgi:hypothetical protein
MASKKGSDNEINTEEMMKRLSLLEDKLNILELQNRESQNLLRILVQPILSNSLEGIFKTPRQLYAYELSNGERSTREIGKLVKLDQKGISNWWREWEKAGLVEKIGKKGQFKALYSLLELLLVFLPSNRHKLSRSAKVNEDKQDNLIEEIETK